MKMRYKIVEMEIIKMIVEIIKIKELIKWK